MNYFRITLFSLVFCFSIYAQDKKDDMIFHAMSDELQRNIDSLHIPGWERPFFIQYAVQEGKIFQIQATMGALTGVNEFSLSNMSVQTLVGNYQMSNINHNNSDYRTSGRNDIAPLDHDYDEIRRRLWLLTDQSYKSAIEAYSTKMAAIKRQNLPQEILDLPDFTPLPAVTYYGKSQPMNDDDEYWKKLARDCSSVFKKYPKIYGSNVGIEVYSGNIYSINNEGTRLLHPVHLIVVAVNAFTKLEDGEEINDRLTYYGWTKEDLPSAETILRETDEMAAHIIDLSNASPIEESYTGPVMVEGGALASFFTSHLLSQQTGLVAYRTPIRSGGIQKQMEDRLNRKVLSSDITVKSIPHTKEYNGVRLIGSYETDAEGVTPGELLLIENGMLRTLMCDRVPKKKVKTPTGNRIYAYQPQNISTRVSAGVLSITTSNGKTDEELKEKLRSAAKEEGLDYAYIVRSLPNGRYHSIYKIMVSDGSEELIRSGVLTNIGLNALKRSLGTSADVHVLNMLAGGVPISVISPAAMVVEEVDIEKRNMQNTTKLPTVSNPLE
ncbi:MAG: hypothetical protein LBQ60_14625 [Bacteroidales bacterium]|jgi:hypothetical protein|nr:hypothetical protein [Bacteroidales bacterium]